jgi:hypothetical protein
LMPRRSDSVSLTCRAVTFVMMIVPVFRRPMDSIQGIGKWPRDGRHESLALRRTCRPAFHGLAHSPITRALEETQMPAIPIRSPDNSDVHLTGLTGRPSSTSAHHILWSLVSQRHSSRQFKAAEAPAGVSRTSASTFGSTATTLAMSIPFVTPR